MTGLTRPASGAQKRYRTFEDLEVYRVAREFRKAMYQVNREQGWRVHQLLNGYIRWLREQKQGASLELREDSPADARTEDQLDDLLDDVHSPFASTL